MEKSDNYTLLNKELHVESFLLKKGTEIHDLSKSFANWDKHFLRVNDMTDDEIVEYLKPDSFYIEGSLCIWSYGREILSFAEWDLIDQLWSYFIDTLHDVVVCGNDKGEFFFPDQPLPVKIEKHKRDLKITINKDKVLQLPQKMFCTVFLNEGINFLNRILKVEPANKEYIQKAEEILKHFEVKRTI